MEMNLYKINNLIKLWFNNLLLIKAPLNMLRNFNHYNKLMVLSKANLKSINTFNYPLEDKNLVLMILNINYDNLKIYLNQFLNLDQMD